MSEKNDGITVTDEVLSKAEAFDKIVAMNNEVMRLSKVMNEKHAAHQAAVKNYKDQDKEMQKMIAAYAVEMPLFDGGKEADSKDGNQTEDKKTTKKKKRAKRAG